MGQCSHRLLRSILTNPRISSLRLLHKLRDFEILLPGFSIPILESHFPSFRNLPLENATFPDSQNAATRENGLRTSPDDTADTLDLSQKAKRAEQDKRRGEDREILIRIEGGLCH